MTNKTNINIITLSDDNYIQHMAVMIASVLTNSKEDEEFNFYVMDGGISEKNKNKILKLKKIKNFNIEYVTGTKGKYNYCPLPDKHVENTYYRYEIPSFLPHLSRVLLLDPDIVVRGSLKEFLQTDLEDYSVGAIENPLSSAYPERLKYPKEYGYFNAGIILMDLNKLRETGFEKQCFDVTKNYPERTWHVDQCFINLVLHNRWKRLPYKYNFMSIMPYKQFKPEYYGLVRTPAEEVIEGMSDALIVHFIGDNKPWEFMSKRLYKNDYWKYLRMTPWKNYIPKDFTALNVFKKYTLSDNNLNLIRKIFGKKLYYFIESWLNQEQKCKTKKKEYDKFKRTHSELNEYKISLSSPKDGYHYIDDLNIHCLKSWNKWFMTNSITEIVCCEDFWNKIEDKRTLKDTIHRYLKFNGKFKIINGNNNEAF